MFLFSLNATFSQKWSGFHLFQKISQNKLAGTFSGTAWNIGGTLPGTLG
jgi:hypothetical protein